MTRRSHRDPPPRALRDRIPGATVIPRRAVVLKAGLRLRFDGLRQHPIEPYYLYVHGDGLEVRASEKDGALHVSVSHRQRDPTAEEVDLVRLAFFPEPSAVMKFCPQETFGAGLINMVMNVILGESAIVPHTFKVWHLREPSRMN